MKGQVVPYGVLEKKEQGGKLNSRSFVISTVGLTSDMTALAEEIPFQSPDNVDIHIHCIPSQPYHKSLILFTLENPILTPMIKHPTILPM